VLFLNRITDTVEIKAHPLVMKFLSKSRVGEYVSDEAQSNNLVRIIKLTQEGRSINPFDGYFHILSNAELEFIYTMLKLTPDAVLDCVIKKYNNKLCIHINGDKILYNLNNKSLLIDFEITKKYSATDTKKKNPKYIFSCITQYNYTIEELKRTCEEKIVSSSKFPMTYINNYSEVVANAYQSTYIHGAVGSRKSSLRMDLDIKDILLSVPNSRILMVSDTITMTDKTFIDMQNLVSSIRLDTSIVVHYTDKENVMDLTTRILIVCYDSLMKFNKYRPTHLVLDEFKNITKRFTIINGAKRYVDGVCTDYTNEDRNDHIKHFFSLFRCSGSVKLYDADCDDYLLNYLEQNTYTPFHIYSLINYTQTNNNIIVMSEEHAISEISELINNDKRISISIAWKKSAYKLHSYLSKDPRLANKRIVVITADGAFDNTLGADQNQVQLKKDLIIDPTLWGRYDAILYTPTITTGISYNEIGTFYKHYAFIGCGSDGTQQAQMMFRVRDVETKTIAVISIGDRLKTLVSNVRGALCDESHSDSYNKYNKSNINGNNDVISLTHIDTVITSQLDYNRGYTNGYNIGSSKTSYFKYWNNIDGLIKQDSELKLLYLVLRSCYRWGARNITFEFYKTHIPRKYNIVEIIQDSLSYNDYKQDTFINASYVKVDFSDEIVNDGSQLFNDIQKSTILMRLGYSTVAYLQQKDAIHIYFQLQSFDFDKMIRAYSKARQINLYLECKNVIYDIFLHSICDKDTDYVKKLMTCHTADAPNAFIRKITGLYIAFKILDIFEMTQDELVDMILNTGSFAYRKDHFFAKIQQFIESPRIKNAYSVICKLGQRDRSKTPYGKLTAILNFAFNQVGMEIKLNREKRNNSDDDYINLSSIESYRFQKSRDYTELMNSNEYEDDLSLLSIKPKILLAGTSELKMLLKMAQMWVCSDESERINISILVVYANINKNSHLIGLSDFNICNTLDDVEEDKYIVQDIEEEEYIVEYVEEEEIEEFIPLAIATPLDFMNVVSHRFDAGLTSSIKKISVMGLDSTTRDIVRSILFDIIDAI
jgi:hypothetical protein